MTEFDKLPVSITRGENSYDLHVMWSIHNRCNYACSYCPDDLHDGNESWLKLEELENFIDRIEDHYLKRLGFKNILFSFTGGEPTLWKDFKNFIKYIDSKGFRCGLTTNASVNPKFWKGISQAFDYICLSFHPESASIDRFIDTFEFFHDAEKTVIPSVRIMMHKENEYWDKSELLLERLKKFSNWTYECVHILEDYGTDSKKIDYSDDRKIKFLEENAFVEQYNDHTKVHVPQVTFDTYSVEYNDGSNDKLNENELINTNQNKFKNWNCYIGIEQLFIHYTGFVKTAGCPSGRVLGHVLTPESIRFPTDPTVCDVEGCYCPTDIRITKTAPEVKLPYTIENDDGHILQIANDESFFKHRLMVYIDNTVFQKFDFSEYISKTNDYIMFLKKKHDIVNTKNILVHIHLQLDFRITDENFRINFIKELKNLNGFKMINIHSDNFKIPKEFAAQILDTSSFVTLTIKSFNHIKTLANFYNEVQERKTTKFQAMISVEDKFEALAAVMLKKYTMMYKYLELEVFATENQPELLKLIKNNGNNSIFKRFRNFFDGYDRNPIEHRMIIDDNLEISNKRKTTLQTEFQTTAPRHKITNFTGWECQVGNKFTAINQFGDIKNSFCGEEKKIGSIMDKTLTYEYGSCITCTQETCPDIQHLLAPKKLISRN